MHLRRSPRFSLQNSPVRTPVPAKSRKATPSSAVAKSAEDSISGPKTRSLRKRATTHIVDSKDQPPPGGARRVSPRFRKPGGDSGGEKVLEVTGEMGRRRSTRLSVSKEGAADSTAVSGGSSRKVRQRSVRSRSDAAEKGTGGSRPAEVCGKRNVRFEDGVHSGNGGGREIRVVKRKVGSGVGVVKSEEGVKVGIGRNLDGRGEATTASVGEWEMVPCSDSGVERDTFSTPKMVNGKMMKSGRYRAEGVGLDLMESCGMKTWTSEQDRMLQRAYLSARPSPHFWKKVSKMVAGKTAKECFDRIHSTYITPPVLRRPVLTRNTNQSPVSNFNLSGSNPSVFFEENTKAIKSKKQRKVLAQRTVRHLLRKHQLEDQGREADLFPVFQSCLDVTSADAECNGALQQDEQFQNSDNNPSKLNSFLAKFKSLDKENIPSPEVLKKVRNPALHEKYIDQLHRREAGWQNSARMAAATSVSKGPENAVLDRGAVKDAKGFLMLEAREAILKFQHTELNSNLCTGSEDENYNEGSDESEAEETLSGLC